MDSKDRFFTLNSSEGRWTLVATILASSMAFIDSTALNVILPTLQQSLQASATDLLWVLNSYLLMLGSIIIVAGSLGDRLGKVKVFKIGILIFTFGSLLCGFSFNIESLILFRAIQGLGGALMIPGSLSIIASIFNPTEKGKAIGIWSSITTIVTICGPVLGGSFAQIGLWRYIFFINLPIGIVAYIITHKKVPDTGKNETGRIDWQGAFLLITSLGLLTFGLLKIPELGIGNILVITSLASGIILFIALLIIEHYTKNPVIPLVLFKNRSFSGINLITFFLYAGLSAMMLFFTINIIQIQEYTQFQGGLTFLPFSLLMILLGRKMGILTDKYGAKIFLIVGPLITGTGMLLLSNVGLTNGPSDYWTTFFFPFILFALGISFTVVPLTTAVMSSIDSNQTGVASGINNSITRISGILANAIIGSIAIYLFSQYTSEQISHLDIPQSLNLEIMQETTKLGEAKAPAHMESGLKISIDRIFKNSFISTYQKVGLISAALAFSSSIIAIFTIKNKVKG